MTEFTNEEWESRKLTINGACIALFDALFMGIYLLGGIYILKAASIAGMPIDGLEWGAIAVVLFLVLKSMGMLTRLVSPRDNYEVEISGTVVE